MTIEITDPQVYRDRAANNPVPFDVPAHEQLALVSHSYAEGLQAAQDGRAYWTDVSEYQSPYTDAYPYPVASFRFHSGYRVDNQADANWAYHRQALAQGRSRIVIAYAVFIPGQLQAVLIGLYQIFGAACPTNRLVLMIDMESGDGFAGSGNHSDEANRWAQAFADYTGTPDSWARSVGYANHFDWQANWPGVDPRLKNITAAYNGADPTPWAWQYAGGNPTYPVPAGAPRNAAPWTTIYVDMNLAHHTIDELEQQFEIVTPEPEDGPLFSAAHITSSDGTTYIGALDMSGKTHVVSADDEQGLQQFIAANPGVFALWGLTAGQVAAIPDFTSATPTVDLDELAAKVAPLVEVPTGVTKDDISALLDEKIPAIVEAVNDDAAKRMES